MNAEKTQKNNYFRFSENVLKELNLQHIPKESHVCIDIYDDVGIGGGASGVSGGLLHPYSPKGFPFILQL